MVLDGTDWRRAIDSHRIQPDRELICARLKAYAEAGFTYLRDGVSHTVDVVLVDARPWRR